MRRHGASIAVVLAGAAALPLMGCGADEYRSLVAGECLPADAQVIGRREADPPRVPCGRRAPIRGLLGRATRRRPVSR
jgi:hypothetical protein